MTARILTLATGVLMASAVQAAETVITDPTNLTAKTTFQIAEGDTVTLSGEVTGKGQLYKDGRGTLKLTHANSDFSGGIFVNTGYLEIDDAQAIGTGNLGLSSHKTSGTNSRNDPASILFAAKDAVFENYISTSGAGNTGSWPSHFRFQETTTLSGEFYSYGNSLSVANIDCGRNGLDDPYPVTTFAGYVHTYDNRSIGLAVYGQIRFSGKLGMGTGGLKASGPGTLVLDMSEPSVVGYVSLGAGRVLCLRENVFDDTRFGQDVDPANSTGFLDLNGKGQRIRSFYCSKTKSSSFPSEASDGWTIGSATPATITVVGSDATGSDTTTVGYGCFSKIDDDVSVVLDATGVADTLRFRRRANTTTGSLIVSNGTMRVIEGSSFRNVGAIYVHGGAEFSNETVADTSLAGVTNLTVNGSFVSTATDPFVDGQVDMAIGAGASVDLGLTLVVKSLTVGGQEKGPGTYTHDDCEEIAAGTVLKIEAQETSATWNGGAGAENTGIAVGANWEGGQVPDFETGGLTATFADGVKATIDRLVNFNGLIVGDAVRAFLFDRGSDEANMRVAGVMTLPDKDDDEARDYCFKAPLTLLEDQTWNVATNMTLTFDSSLRAKRSVTVNNRAQAGFACTNVVFLGTNMVDGALVVNRGRTRVSGVITTSSGVDTRAWSADYGIGFLGTKQSDESTDGGRLVLDNVIFEKPVRTYGPSKSSGSDKYVSTTANSTNVFRGEFLFPGVAWQRIAMGKNSVISFENGLRASTRAYVSGGNTCTCYVRNKPQTFSSTSSFFSTTVRFVYETTGNSISPFRLDGGILDLRVDGAFSGGYLMDNGESGSRATVLLHATSSRVDRVSFIKEASVVDGEEGSVFEIGGTGESVFGCQLTGAASLLKTGTGTLTFDNAVLTSEGGLTVRNGTARFETDEVWKKGSLDVDGDGVVSIADGVRVRVLAATVGGVELELGDYTYASLADRPELQKFFANTTGVLCVRPKGGLILFVR